MYIASILYVSKLLFLYPFNKNGEVSNKWLIYSLVTPIILCILGLCGNWEGYENFSRHIRHYINKAVLVIMVIFIYWINLAKIKNIKMFKIRDDIKVSLRIYLYIVIRIFGIIAFIIMMCFINIYNESPQQFNMIIFVIAISVFNVHVLESIIFLHILTEELQSLSSKNINIIDKIVLFTKIIDQCDYFNEIYSGPLLLHIICMFGESLVRSNMISLWIRHQLQNDSQMLPYSINKNGFFLFLYVTDLVFLTTSVKQNKLEEQKFINSLYSFIMDERYGTLAGNVR
ncbi:hypothetical protein O3M35_011508 [Rhynocoris fuscipes]|uniref:Gustatory receptor n=1 Tax=Rhynocoris fuscipes TaxID=488301 RepID=A0AAW1CW01_9HEMI